MIWAQLSSTPLVRCGWVTPFQDMEPHRSLQLEQDHMTCAHWLVTQSTTSYIYCPSLQLKVLVLLLFSLSGVYTLVSAVPLAAAPTAREIAPVAWAHTFYIPCAELESAQPLLPSEVWSARHGSNTCVICVANYKKYIYVTNATVLSLPRYRSQVHQSRDEPRAGALSPMGDHSD